MASKKLMDLAVKTGEYTNKEGAIKGTYENIGAVMESDGRKYILLNRTFNPAGLPNPDNRSTIIVSLFEPRGKESAPAPKTNFDDMESDIPF